MYYLSVKGNVLFSVGYREFCVEITAPPRAGIAIVGNLEVVRLIGTQTSKRIREVRGIREAEFNRIYPASCSLFIQVNGKRAGVRISSTAGLNSSVKGDYTVGGRKIVDGIGTFGCGKPLYSGGICVAIQIQEIRGGV